jgi:RNA polymerase sigma factor (sigma-70 family)
LLLPSLSELFLWVRAASPCCVGGIGLVADWTWPSEQLVAAAQHGDMPSITALVSGSHPHVQRFARSLCASPEDAEDAAQEALIVLYRKIGTLRASGALASWLFRIVRNECVRRSRLSMRRHAAPRDCVIPSAEAMPSAEDDALRRWEVGRVSAAIAALPVDQRTVLIMRDIEGVPGRVVAQSLGLSTPAMKSRLHRARATVRHALHDITQPPLGDANDTQPGQ